MSEVPTVIYLEMLGGEALQPAAEVEGLELRRVAPADANLNRRYYQEVGADWNWVERLCWSELDWQAHVEREELSTWLALHEGEEVGYVELEQQPQGQVQISYFGLLPQACGKGYGGAMLSRIVELAWQMPGTRRVWVHTCTDDHPAALTNYQKRGFVIFDTKKAESPD